MKWPRSMRSCGRSGSRSSSRLSSILKATLQQVARLVAGAGGDHRLDDGGLAVIGSRTQGVESSLRNVVGVCAVLQEQLAHAKIAGPGRRAQRRLAHGVFGPAHRVDGRPMSDEEAGDLQVGVHRAVLERPAAVVGRKLDAGIGAVQQGVTILVLVVEARAGQVEGVGTGSVARSVGQVPPRRAAGPTGNAHTSHSLHPRILHCRDSRRIPGPAAPKRPVARRRPQSYDRHGGFDA